MAYCYSGYCYCGRCRRPCGPQPFFILVLLAVPLTLLAFSSLFKFEMPQIEASPQVLALVLVVGAVLLPFLLRWLKPGGSCRRTNSCGCWKCSHWKGGC